MTPFAEHVAQRLQSIALLPELHHALLHMVAYDEGRKAQNPQWGTVIPTLQHLLGGTAAQIEPFAAAWSLMYAVIVRLDHLQDNDPVDDPLPTVDRLNAQYNLLFSYYVLATSLLDLLSSQHIPTHRMLRLRRFWTDMVLRMASGQQRDLVIQIDEPRASPLDQYQQLAQAKTGATFALAFGGTALLLTDDSRLIDMLTTIGELYGTLLQFSDDLQDATVQSNTTLTLPTALTLAQPAHVIHLIEHSSAGFGAYLYHHYYKQVEYVLAPVSVDLRQGILDLFAQTFHQLPGMPEVRP